MSKASVVIIDDDHIMRRTLMDILQAKGYETAAAKDGAEGLALLRQRQPQVVLIDLGLPDMSGLGVLKAVRADYPATDAIILTGNATLDSAIEATNQGAFSYLVKPYDIDQLLVNIMRALEKQKADEQVLRHGAALEKSNAVLKTLYEISKAIGKTLDLDKLLHEVLGTFLESRIFPLDLRGAMFLAEGEVLRLASSIGLSEAAVDSCRSVPFGKCLCGLAAAKGEILVSNDSGKDARHTTCISGASRHGHIVIPLKTAGRLVGVLVLYTPPGTECDGSMLDICAAVGGQIAIAVEHAKLYEATRLSSLHDALTGLGNRRFMEAQLQKLVEAAKRYKRQLSIVMLDVDHFKRYNDARGHVEGDKLLKKLAGILLTELRCADYVFRYGGEEFLAVLPETSLSMACEVAERLRRAVEAAAGVTVSLGAASCQDAGKAMESLIRRADEALYRAKRNGRNRVEADRRDEPPEND